MLPFTKFLVECSPRIGILCSVNTGFRSDKSIPSRSTPSRVIRNGVERVWRWWFLTGKQINWCSLACNFTIFAVWDSTVTYEVTNWPSVMWSQTVRKVFKSILRPLFCGLGYDNSGLRLALDSFRCGMGLETFSLLWIVLDFVSQQHYAFSLWSWSWDLYYWSSNVRSLHRSKS